MGTVDVQEGYGAERGLGDEEDVDGDEYEYEEGEECGAIPKCSVLAMGHGEGGDVGDGGERRRVERHMSHVGKASRECAAVGHS